MIFKKNALRERRGSKASILAFSLLVPTVLSGFAAGRDFQPFLQKYCFECHDTETKKGGLDLTALNFEISKATNFSAWVTVHDRVANGEMPPKKKERPAATDLEEFTSSLTASLISAEKARMSHEGRSTQRRLNRYEYENALRDL